MNLGRKTVSPLFMKKKTNMTVTPSSNLRKSLPLSQSLHILHTSFPSTSTLLWRKENNKWEGGGHGPLQLWEGQGQIYLPCLSLHTAPTPALCPFALTCPCLLALAWLAGHRLSSSLPLACPPAFFPSPPLSLSSIYIPSLPFSSLAPLPATPLAPLHLLPLAHLHPPAYTHTHPTLACHPHPHTWPRLPPSPPSRTRTLVLVGRQMRFGWTWLWWDLNSCWF